MSMRYHLDERQCRNLDISTRREWLLTNGIGGYAMGTASGINTRRYHGHLIAATTPPTGRMLLLAGIDATVQVGSTATPICSNQYPGAVHPDGYLFLRSFSVDGSAAWKYRGSGFEIEKRLIMHADENAVSIEYWNLGSKPAVLSLRPLLCHREHHGNFSESPDYPRSIQWHPDQLDIEHAGISLVLSHTGAERVPVHGWYYRFDHARETERGLPARDDLYCPCELRYVLQPGEHVVLVASEGKPAAPQPAHAPVVTSEHRLRVLLQEAASRLLVETSGRASIIAGYPWFTDWGRDTMISLPGMCLCTGKVELARRILRAYASQLRQGLIPNRFVERGETPDYNTVDATLWFANAAYKTLLSEWDPGFAAEMMAALREVYEWHTKGTEFGIKVDPVDGLLHQGEPGVQLTWMDVKIGDWVVTPRHGKPIEINGLWINALRVTHWLADRLDEPDAPRYAKAAEQAESCFDQKFWHPMRGHYVDTVDPIDATLRPNQVIALSLPFCPADPEHARQALDVVTRELLTTHGLRTLGPNEPGYVGRFQGAMEQRDAAYHQGTVWPWLLGPYVSALVRFTGDQREGKRILREAKLMLQEYGLGGIAEVYDGDEPQSPGGCPWQAWSVAEILRAWIEDCQGD